MTTDVIAIIRFDGLRSLRGQLIVIREPGFNVLAKFSLMHAAKWKNRYRFYRVTVLDALGAGKSHFIDPVDILHNIYVTLGDTCMGLNLLNSTGSQNSGLARLRDSANGDPNVVRELGLRGSFSFCNQCGTPYFTHGIVAPVRKLLDGRLREETVTFTWVRYNYKIHDDDDETPQITSDRYVSGLAVDLLPRRDVPSYNPPRGCCLSCLRFKRIHSSSHE